MYHQIDVSLALSESERERPERYQSLSLGSTISRLHITGLTRYEVIDQLVAALDGLTMTTSYEWPLEHERASIPAENIAAITIAADEAAKRYPWDETTGTVTPPDAAFLADADTVAPPDGDYAHRSPTMRPLQPPADPAPVDPGDTADADDTFDALPF